MVLSITTTHCPATDLGFLLHKHPARCQSFSLSFGQAHVFYPEAEGTTCTATLVLDVDPVALVRGRKAYSIGQYVNDRPYIASSFLSVALAQVYGSALNGKCKDRPELVDTSLPLSATLAVVPSTGGEDLLRRLFEPLGYAVDVTSHPLDPKFPSWGDSPYYTLTLTGTHKLSELLAHLYVLIPVLDGSKHYWVGDAEVEKLLRKGEGWLAAHPEHAYITQRYLKRRRSLVRQAMDRLIESEGVPAEEDGGPTESAVERPLRVHDQRLRAVVDVLKDVGAQRVLDLGCGEGKLLKLLLDETTFTEVVGMDVAYRSLERAQERLRLDRMPTHQQKRLKLVHGSLLYRDARLEGFDAAAVVEVIEHLDAPRLAAFEQVVFAYARPSVVVITTPNREYNQLFPSLSAGAFRHKDHRFEWTRAEFEQWGKKVATTHGYTVSFVPLCPVHDAHGGLSQMGIFKQVTAEEK